MTFVEDLLYYYISKDKSGHTTLIYKKRKGRIMSICCVCKNPLKTRKIKANYNGPLCTPVYKKETYCEYCEWKGTAGTGLLLKEIIKEYNNE